MASKSKDMLEPGTIVKVNDTICLVVKIDGSRWTLIDLLTGSNCQKRGSYSSTSNILDIHIFMSIYGTNDIKIISESISRFLQKQSKCKITKPNKPKRSNPFSSRTSSDNVSNSMFSIVRDLIQHNYGDEATIISHQMDYGCGLRYIEIITFNLDLVNALTDLEISGVTTDDGSYRYSLFNTEARRASRHL